MQEKHLRMIQNRSKKISFAILYDISILKRSACTNTDNNFSVKRVLCFMRVLNYENFSQIYSVIFCCKTISI